MLTVNGIAMVIAVLLCVPAVFIVSPSALWEEKALLKSVVLLAGIVIYMVLHELVHGICMRAISGVRPHYGFTGMYAYAGSQAYFGRTAYVFIALAPVVLWGVVLGVINFFVPLDWFWVVYIIQIGNLSGAGGDLYVTCRMARMPADILVQDTGVAMTVYAKQ